MDRKIDSFHLTILFETEKDMKGVILDRDSLGLDIDYSAILDQLDEWETHASTPEDRAEERIGDADVVITNKVYLGEKQLSQAKSLKLVCVAATGVNNIDLVAAQKFGITVCNVRAYATPSVVEHTFSLILSLMRNIPAHQRDVQQGLWHQSPYFCLLTHPISELAGKKLGIIGYGELGKAVASVARAFGMEVLIAKSLRASSQNDSERVALDELLSQADIISLHCPLTPETQDLINQERIGLMKKTAIVINTARGGIVNETALAEALKHGRIAGAGVDVLSTEPPTSHEGLLDNTIPNLIVTPHIAWASKESRQRLVNEIALNIKSNLAGEPRNVIV